MSIDNIVVLSGKKKSGKDGVGQEEENLPIFLLIVWNNGVGARRMASTKWGVGLGSQIQYFLSLAKIKVGQ